MTPPGARLRLAPCGAKRTRLLGLLAAASLAFVFAGDAAAQARRGADRAQPPPDRTIAFAESETRCSAAYGDALAEVMARPGAQPLATIKRVRTPLPDFRGYWLFQEGGERRRQRDAQKRLVDGNKVCEEEQSRARRTKCLKWTTREPEPSREPPVPTPPMSKDEARLARQLSEFVQNKGAPPEFLSNGKYTIMSERVATDLEVYLTQPPHPALCTGAEEFLEFLEDQLPLLRKRSGDVADMQPLARSLASSRIADLAAALTAPPTSSPPPAPDAVPAGAPPMPPLLLVASAKAGLARLAALTLVPAEAAAVEAEPDALAALARAAAAIGSDSGTPLNAAMRAQARTAYRTLELLAYAERLGELYHDLDTALFGNMAAARKAHAATCTCGG